MVRRESGSSKSPKHGLRWSGFKPQFLVFVPCDLSQPLYLLNLSFTTGRKRIVVAVGVNEAA